MLNRVTNLTMSAAAQRNLQLQQSKLAGLQDKASSLDKISRPSDDPSATAQALQTRTRQAAAAQYSRNIDDGNGWLTVADSALGQATNILNRVRDLTLQASNDALSAKDRASIGIELKGLNDDLLSVANTQHLGRNIFAGTSDKDGAFTPPIEPNPAIPGDTGTPPKFNGTLGSTVDRRVSDNRTIRVDADGATIFGDGGTSLFALIGQITGDLDAGKAPNTHLTALDQGIKNVISGRAEIGTRQAELERAGTVNTDLEASLDAQKTGIEKADLGSVIMDLKLQETNYQVALAATARVLQPTLMDFLR